MKGQTMAGKCEHGLTTRECMVCASPKYGAETGDKGATMTTKLDSGQKHFLRLIEKGQQCPDGWCPVSKVLYPLVQKTMPAELVEHHPTEDGRGRARLTQDGQNLLTAMAWL
jgi:hypothetical protein